MPITNAELAQQLEDLHARVDELESNPTVGKLVDFTTLDRVTGTPLSGVGLVVDVDDDGTLVAPLAVQGIRLASDEFKTR